MLFSGGAIARIFGIKHPRPEAAVYTDAATSSRIAAALVIDVTAFSVPNEFDISWDETADPCRGGPFPPHRPSTG